MITININKIQYEIIKGILDLFQIRKQENSTNKKTNINAFKISKHINRDYKAVKRQISNLKESI